MAYNDHINNCKLFVISKVSYLFPKQFGKVLNLYLQKYINFQRVMSLSNCVTPCQINESILTFKGTE